MKSCQRLIISLYDKANLNLVYYKEIALEFISQKENNCEMKKHVKSIKSILSKGFPWTNYI